MENFVPVPARTCMLPVGRLKAATFFVFLSRSGLPLPPLRPLQYYLLNDKNLKDINSRVGKVPDKYQQEWNASQSEVLWILDHCRRTQKRTQSNTRYRMDKKMYRRLCAHINSRLFRHKPLQYILGSEFFGDLEIKVRPPVLIPRWETAEWCSDLVHKFSRLDFGPEPLTILDIGTGTGCIALFMAKHLPNARIYGVDINPQAVALAKENQLVHNQTKNLWFGEADIWKDLRSKVDVILSNPPYIPEDRRGELEKSVGDWEDPRALFAGEYGTTFHTGVIERISRFFLRPREDHRLRGAPEIVMEIDGSHQCDAIMKVAKANQFSVEFQEDSAGKCRTVCLTRE